MQLVKAIRTSLAFTYWSSLQMESCHRIFEVVEVLQQILSHLHMRELLIDQRVNKTFQNAVQESPDLRTQAYFLPPHQKTIVAWKPAVDLNPMCTSNAGLTLGKTVDPYLETYTIQLSLTTPKAREDGRAPVPISDNSIDVDISLEPNVLATSTLDNSVWRCMPVAHIRNGNYFVANIILSQIRQGESTWALRTTRRHLTLPSDYTLGDMYDWAIAMTSYRRAWQ